MKISQITGLLPEKKKYLYDNTNQFEITGYNSALSELSAKEIVVDEEALAKVMSDFNKEPADIYLLQAEHIAANLDKILRVK